MKRILFFMFLAAGSISCMEEFEHTDPTRFNESIAASTDISSAGQLIMLYYDYPEGEGTPDLTITQKELTDNRIEVTLIHDNLPDDSQQAIKIVMTVAQTGEIWTVHEIRKNWKCREGRGHTNWGTAWCR
jgi:hypothetical protein